MQRSFSVPGGIHIPHDRVWNTSEVKTFIKLSACSFLHDELREIGRICFLKYIF